MQLDKIYEIERDYHNRIAGRISYPGKPREDVFWKPKNELIERVMGDVKGKRLLDLGCSWGRDSMYFASKGAIVTGIDISDKAIEKAKSFAAEDKLRIEFSAGNAESIDAKSNYFDIVYIGSTLHHLPRVGRSLEECRRVMKPGGLIISAEPLAGNPIVEFNRKILNPDKRTPTEHPFRRGELEGEFARVFGNARAKYFYTLSPASFLFRFLRNECLYKLSFRFLYIIDRIIEKRLGYCYNWMIVIWARK